MTYIHFLIAVKRNKNPFCPNSCKIADGLYSAIEGVSSKPHCRLIPPR